MIRNSAELTWHNLARRERQTGRKRVAKPMHSFSYLTLFCPQDLLLYLHHLVSGCCRMLLQATATATRGSHTAHSILV